MILLERRAIKVRQGFSGSLGLAKPKLNPAPIPVYFPLVLSLFVFRKFLLYRISLYFHTVNPSSLALSPLLWSLVGNKELNPFLVLVLGAQSILTVSVTLFIVVPILFYVLHFCRVL